MDLFFCFAHPFFLICLFSFSHFWGKVHQYPIVISYHIISAMKNLESWLKPERVSGGLLNIMNTLEVQKDPLGVVLVLGCWNYPVCLSLQPIVGAIAAG